MSAAATPAAADATADLAPALPPGTSARLVPYAWARAARLLLIARDPGPPAAWICDETPPEAIAEAARTFGVVEWMTVGAGHLRQALSQAYAGNEGSAAQVVGEVEGEVDLSRLMQELPAVEDLLEAEDDAPVIRMINALLTQAAREGASDIHIEAFEQSSVVRLRVDARRIEAAGLGRPGLARLWAAGGALALIAAFYDTHFALLMICTVLLYTTACLGLTLQFGFSGVANFAGAAFFGIGSYATAVLATHSGLPHLLIVVISGVIAALVGSLLIAPVLRTRGHYAALVTIAFGILFKTFIEVNDVLGGPQGLQVPGMRLFGYALNDGFTVFGADVSFYLSYALLSLGMCGGVFVVVKALERSWVGLAMDVVRTDETAAATFGLHIARWKVVAFMLGNFFAGIAGSVYGMVTGFVAPNNFTFSDSLLMLSIVILGGLGNAVGLVPAAIIVLVLPEKLQFIQEYRFLFYAALVIAILLFRPAGLMPRKTRLFFAGEASR